MRRAGQAALQAVAPRAACARQPPHPSHTTFCTVIARLPPRPAHSSLHRVHERNVDDLMGAALPYHETEQFVRLAQILRLDPRSKWAFLEPMQSSGAPAPREALVLRCTTDRVRWAAGGRGGAGGSQLPRVGRLPAWALRRQCVGAPRCCTCPRPLRLLQRASFQTPPRLLTAAASSSSLPTLPPAAVPAALCVRPGAAAGRPARGGPRGAPLLRRPALRVPGQAEERG